MPEHVAATAPKSGHDPGENEDAHAAAPGRFAVADGASEGWNSGPWARTLAAAFARTPPTPDTFAGWLADARGAFAPPPTGGAWYAEAKQAQGSFATLLGVTVVPAAGGGWKWRAVAVGDSCLFQVRGGNLAAAFPVERVDDFSNRPRLIGSAGGSPEPDWFAGRAEPGDVFYLLTDAAAEWFLRAATTGESPWVELDRVLANDAPPAAFGEWVEALRSTRRMKNDDATVVRIGVGPANAHP